MHKTFRFLFLLLLSASFLVACYFLFFSRPGWQEIQSGMTGTHAFLIHFRNQFKHTDSWNWILISFITALFVLMFSFNDVVIWKAIKGRLARKKILFEPNGFTWLLRIIFNSSLLLFEVVAIAYIINISASSPHIYNSVEDIKADHLTLLVLGTSKKIQGTEVINVYFTQRINETIDAYKSGKVDRIILSGDRNGSGYDETKDMMTALVAAGVPKSVITLDPSGFRTFDSIKRLEIPVNETVVIVSQTFHLERALYLARSEGLMAVGLAADGNMTTKMFKRELLAKTKVLLDIYVLNTQSNGIAAKPRRQVEWTKTTDIILMLFVLICVAVAGQLSKNLLTY